MPFTYYLHELEHKWRVWWWGTGSELPSELSVCSCDPVQSCIWEWHQSLLAPVNVKAKYKGYVMLFCWGNSNISHMVSTSDFIRKNLSLQPPPPKPSWPVFLEAKVSNTHRGQVFCACDWPSVHLATEHGIRILQVPAIKSTGFQTPSESVHHIGVPGLCFFPNKSPPKSSRDEEATDLSQNPWHSHGRHCGLENGWVLDCYCLPKQD